jgi:ribulose bisphosphate carboxylase small subunit
MADVLTVDFEDRPEWARRAVSRLDRTQVWGMWAVNEGHAKIAKAKKKTALEEIQEVEAFLADRESQWARIVPMNERRAR